MSAGAFRFWRLHSRLCALVFGLALALALWLMSDTGTSIGAVIVFGMALFAVGIALLQVVLSTLALLALRRFWPGLSAWAIPVVHLVSLPMAVGIPLVWPDLEERWDRLEDRRFADCLEVRTCQVSVVERDGHPAYSVALEVEACRSMNIGVNLSALCETSEDERVHSKSSLDTELKRGSGTLQLYAETADPGVERRWIVEMWERRGLSEAVLGPFGGSARWTGFTREEVPAYGWREDLEYRALPPCERR